MNNITISVFKAEFKQTEVIHLHTVIKGIEIVVGGEREQMGQIRQAACWEVGVALNWFKSPVRQAESSKPSSTSALENRDNRSPALTLNLQELVASLYEMWHIN